ncbi:retrovirus-related pol polyprotein from transposon TNT 1-94 [Tanacetum coccineum]
MVHGNSNRKHKEAEKQVVHYKKFYQGTTLTFRKPKKIRSKRRLFDTPSLIESNSPEFDQNFDIEEQSEEEERETMTEIMEQYMSKTRENYGSGVTRPTIYQDTPFELKGQFLKELRDNTFSGSKHEDANELIEKVLDIVDLFYIPKVTQDQIMLRAFPVSLTGAASRWLRNQPSGSITTWEEPDESLFRAWERFKELMMKCTIPSKTSADAKVAIQDMVEYSQKWHNGTSSRTKSTKTFDGLAAIQAQLNNLRREINKVNEKVYAAHVRCKLCKGPHYTKDCPQKEEGKNLEEAYYTHLEESLIIFMAELAKRHEENLNIIKEIRASTDAAIRNQGASITTLEIQIEQMSKVLQERGSGSLPNTTEINPQDQVKSILTARADFLRYAKEVQDVNILDAYDHTLPQKEKDTGSFTLPCFIHNICFNKALVDLGASESVMPFSTYTNFGLGILSHTRLTIELADRTIKQARGIAENVLVRIGFTIVDDEDMTKTLC